MPGQTKQRSQALQATTLTFAVDFGSAPVEAFEELVDALRNLGAAELEVGASNEAKC